jgi:hypothetical protein
MRGTRLVLARRMRSLVLMALITISIRASADDTLPGTGYRLQTLGVDGITTGLFVGALETRGQTSDQLLEYAFAGFAIGAPTIHLVHHRWGGAAKSLGLRLALPVLGGWIGSKFGPSLRDNCHDCDAQDGAPNNEKQIFAGIGVGVVAAMAVDTWLIAGEDDSREPAITPSVRAANGGVSFGLAGRF